MVDAPTPCLAVCDLPLCRSGKHSGEAWPREIEDSEAAGLRPQGFTIGR